VGVYEDYPQGETPPLKSILNSVQERFRNCGNYCTVEHIGCKMKALSVWILKLYMHERDRCLISLLEDVCIGHVIMHEPASYIFMRPFLIARLSI